MKDAETARAAAEAALENQTKQRRVLKRAAISVSEARSLVKELESDGDSDRILDL